MIKKLLCSLAFFMPLLAHADTFGPSIHHIETNGSTVTQRDTLNFTGSGVSVADNIISSRTEITITGGGGGSSLPGGTTTQLQINGGGVLIGTATLTMNTTSNLLTIGATTQFSSVSTTTWTNVSTMTFGSGTDLRLSYVTAGNCLQTDSNGNVIDSGGACGGAGGGSSVYPASSTASFPFGFSASTGVFTSSLTAPVATITTMTVTSSMTVLSTSRFVGAVTGNGGFTTLSGSFGAGSGFSTFSASPGNIQVAQGSSNNGTAIQYFDYQSRSSVVPTHSAITFIYKPQDESQNFSGGANFGILSTSNTVSPAKTWATIGATNGSNMDTGNTTDYFFINISTAGTRQGNVGIGVKDPSTKLQVAGHIEVSSTTPTLSTCGVSPSIVGNDMWGKITVGSGVIGTCTMTFAVPWNNAPSCNVISGTAIASLTGTTTTSAFTFTGTSLTSDVVMYQCGGWQ